MTDHPHFIIEHKPEFCSNCGNILSDIGMQLSARRQVIDIPPIKPTYIEIVFIQTLADVVAKTRGHSRLLLKLL